MLVYFSSPQAGCVQDHASVHIYHDLEERPPGEIYDLNEQCEMSFGVGSAICGVGIFTLVWLFDYLNDHAGCTMVRT